MSVNLSKLHPISSLYPFRKTIWIFIGLVLILALIKNIDPKYEHSDLILTLLFPTLLLFSLIWLVGVTYYSLKRASYFYGIDDSQLIFIRGIIIKERGYFQLSRITEVYVDRSLVDLMFGLYSLHVSTPTAQSDKFARIEGLSETSALALQSHLSTLLELKRAKNQDEPTYQELGAMVSVLG